MNKPEKNFKNNDSPNLHELHVSIVILFENIFIGEATIFYILFWNVLTSSDTIIGYSFEYMNMVLVSVR